MTEITPQFLDTLSYAGKFDRQFFRDILTEGIVGTNDLKVTEKGTPDMSVDVAAGSAYVQGDQSTTQGHYRIYNDATVNKAIAASDPTNPRKDRVIAQVKDSTDIGGALDEWEIQVLTGTPAASPTPPALPDDALDLAIVDVGNGVTEILDANITDQRERIGLQNVSEKGWDKAGTFTYASATTITVASGAASIYQKGDKIKYTQSTGGTKYAYIVAVADTLLTISESDDYTLENEAITSPYYSKIENPQGFPTWFNWTPVYTAAGTMTYTSVATTFAYFKIIGNSCEIILRAIGTTGGTATNILEATIPVDNIDNISPLAGFTKDTAIVSASVYVDSNKIMVRKYDDSDYGLGADRQMNTSGFYKI